MKAIVFTEYGPPEVLRVAKVAKPLPKDKEVLIGIRATALNFGDLLVRNFKAVTPAKFHMPLLFWLIGRVTFGFFKPRVRILGSEFAGEVAAVGKAVTLFKKGAVEDNATAVDHGLGQAIELGVAHGIAALAASKRSGERKGKGVSGFHLPVRPLAARLVSLATGAFLTYERKAAARGRAFSMSPVARKRASSARRLVYLIRDWHTGVILFAGRVVEPATAGPQSRPSPPSPAEGEPAMPE